jgi:hypothetical protein
VGGDVGGALAQAGGLIHVLEAVEFCFEAGECVERSGVCVAELFEELGALLEGNSSEGGEWAGAGGCVKSGDGIRGRLRGVRGQGSEEDAGALAQGCGGALDGGGGGLFGLEHGLDITGQLVEALGSEADAEVVACDVLEFVRLVEEDGCGGGEDACVGGRASLQLDGHVGEEEVVVDDDEVGLERLAAHGGDEAALPIGAGLAEAGLAARVDLGPECGVLGQHVDLCAVAGCGGLLPGGDGVELADLFEAGKQRRIAQRVELVLAEVVVASLHVADLERAEDGFEEGDVLEVELLLKVLCSGGDDDALLAFAGEAECGEEVGERFSGSGSGFDDQVALVGEGFFDGAGHLVLALAVLEGEGGAGEQA